MKKYQYLLLILLIVYCSLSFISCANNKDNYFRRDEFSDVFENEPAYNDEIEKTDTRKVIEFAAIKPLIFKSEILKYNSENKTYRVNPAKAVEFDKFDTFIYAEKPDIFEINSFYKYYLYTEKGYLYSLNRFIKNSDNISLDYYPEWLLSLFDINGDLYTIPKMMHVMPLIIPEDSADFESWDIYEFIDFIEKNPNSFSRKGLSEVDIKSGIVEDSLLNSIEEFVDFDSCESYFDGDKFKDLLRRIKNLNIDTSSKTIIERAREGETVVFSEYLSSPEELMKLEQKTGRKLRIIGYPSATGKESKSVIAFDSMLGINVATDDPDGVWTFMESYLTSDADIYTTGIPTRKDAFESALLIGTDQETINIEGIYYYPVTDEHINKIRKAYEKTFIPLHSDIIYEIVIEEVQYYFDGSKDLNDVCDIIQSRAQLMLNEK